MRFKTHDRDFLVITKKNASHHAQAEVLKNQLLPLDRAKNIDFLISTAG